MSDTDAILAAAGAALYGQSWRGPLARLLGINERTIYRYATGLNKPSRWVWGVIAAECDRKAAENSAMAARLRAIAANSKD